MKNGFSFTQLRSSAKTRVTPDKVGQKRKRKTQTCTGIGDDSVGERHEQQILPDAFAIVVQDTRETRKD